jgi:hypothetical protein
MNNTFPKEISLEAGTWLRLQMTIAAARATQPLHAELQDIDGFLNGLLVAVAQLVPAVLQSDPAVAARLAPRWKRAAERYEALSAGELPAPDDEPLAQLEARHLMYRACEGRGLWTERAPAVRRPCRTPTRRAKH